METVLTCELGNLSFVNKMLVLAEVIQEPRAEYFITLCEGQVHIEQADEEPEEDEYVIDGLSVIHELQGTHIENENFHEVNIFQTDTHWKVVGASYSQGYRFLIDAGYKGSKYMTFEMEGRPLVVREVSQWEVDYAAKLCKEYNEGVVTEEEVITPHYQFRKENGVWRKYE